MNNLKRQKFSIIYLTIAYFIPFIIQAVFFGYQVSKGIFSIWNAVTVFMMVFLYAFAYKRVKSANIKVEERIVEKKEEFDKIIKDYNQKTTKKTRLVVVLVAIVFAALSGLFYNVYSSKAEGLTLVNSKVIDQWGETTVVTTETDEGIEQTESDYIEVTVEYEFNGETKEAVITARTTDKIYVDELKIYIDESGKFVADYGRIEVWKFEAIVFISFACLMLLCAIFGLGVEFIAGSVFMVIGAAIMFLVGSPLFENFLFNDITCFTFLFANVGVILFMTGIFSLIFGKYQVYGVYNTALAFVGRDLVDEYGDQENQNNAEDERYCDNCGEKINETDKFCGNCGNKLNQ